MTSRYEVNTSFVDDLSCLMKTILPISSIQAREEKSTKF